MSYTMYMVAPGYEFESTKQVRDAMKRKCSDELEDYFASINEARECLNLLQSLSETFDAPKEEWISADIKSDVLSVLSLLSVAAIKPTMHDKIMLQSFDAGKTILSDFDSPYLRNAPEIRAARYLVDVLLDFHVAINKQRNITTEALEYEQLLITIPKRHLIQRFQLARKYIDCRENIIYWQSHISGKGPDKTYNPRCIAIINNLYCNKIEHGYPLIFYKSPLQAEQIFFEDSAYEDIVRQEWAQSKLHKFGDDRLWRLITLYHGVNNTIGFHRPTDNKEKPGANIETIEELNHAYPEFSNLFRFDQHIYKQSIIA